MDKERREEIRNDVERWKSVESTVMPVEVEALSPLLDMADERDRYRGLLLDMIEGSLIDSEAMSRDDDGLMWQARGLTGPSRPKIREWVQRFYEMEVNDD